MQHIESMGDKWFALGVDAKQVLGVVTTTLELGGSRPAWGMKDETIERMLMAWPSDSLLRTSVLMAGKPEGRLTAVAVSPLMEGFANTLTIKDTHPWKDGHAGEILAAPEDFPPLWFYDPLFFRDAGEGAEGKSCEFLLSGLCFGIRRALLDELTVTEGPAYEKYALEWMKNNPEEAQKLAHAELEALTGGFIGEFETVHCNGAYHIGKHRIRCASRWGHGDVAVRRALAASCNPYFMDVALRMGYEPRLYEAYRKLGFGTAPVIGIPTRSGLLPSDAWKRRRQHDAWRAGDTAYASIGQGFLSATPLQIARYMLTIANQGEILETRLVRDPGTGMPDTARRVVGRMDWSPAALRAVLEGMTDVVASPHGTGRRAAIPGLTIAGKTGTAEYREKGELRKHAWMIAQVPAENPEAVFAVICENADSGGHAAAAVLRSLLIQMYRPDLGHAPATPLPPAVEGANAPVPIAGSANAPVSAAEGANTPVPAAEDANAPEPAAEDAEETGEADDVTAKPEAGAEDASVEIAPPAPVLELEPTEVAP